MAAVDERLAMLEGMATEHQVVIDGYGPNMHGDYFVIRLADLPGDQTPPPRRSS